MSNNEEFFNLTLPIVNLVEKGFYYKKIPIPFDLLEEELVKLKKEIIDFKQCKAKISKRSYHNYGYFSYMVLDKYLSDYFKVPKNYIINPTNVYIGRNTNRYLKQIDLQVEQIFKEDFKINNFKRPVTCNYCVNSIHYSNKSEYSLLSYEFGFIYIQNKDNLLREKLYF